MQKIIFLGIFFCFSINLRAQTTFQKIYSLQSNPGLSGLVVTANNGYAMAGFVDFQSWFIKLDPLGQVLISKMLETPDAYSIRSIENCNDGGFILSGDGRAGPQQYNLNLCKLDSMGNISWTKSFGNSDADFATTAKQVNDGGFIACGRTNLQGGRTYVVKTDANGNLQWTKSYADTLQSFSSNFPRDIIQTSDQGFLICGNINRGPSDIDAFLIKTNSIGEIIWNRIYENPEWNSFEKIQISSDGNYALCGWVDGIADSIDGRNMSLIKVDPSGNILWSKAYEKAGVDFASNIDISSDNGYILCGLADANSAAKCVILKTDSSGNMIWNKGFPMFISFPTGNIVRSTPDNGYVIGSIYTPSFPQKIFLGKTDSSGDGNNCSQSIVSFTESSVSFTYTSGFITGTNDSTENFNLSTSALTPAVNTICFTNNIESLSGRSPINLFPNPVSLKTCYDIIHGTACQVVSANGSRVYFEKKILDSHVELDLSSLTAGIYFLLTERGFSKIVKE